MSATNGLASSIGQSLDDLDGFACSILGRHVLCRRCGDSPVRLLLHYLVRGVGEPYGGEGPGLDRAGGTEGGESPRT
jgi:hypothetical protein